MAEEKPKAELIKHKKSDDQPKAEEPKKEKKKVVVVKKKPHKKHHKVVAVTDKKDASGAPRSTSKGADDSSEAKSSAPRRAGNLKYGPGKKDAPRRDGRIGGDNRQGGGGRFNRDNRQGDNRGGDNRQGGGGRFNRDNRQGDNRGGDNRQGGGRFNRDNRGGQGGRPGQGGGRPGQGGGRPGQRPGGRPGQGGQNRFGGGGGRPAPGAGTPPAADNKPGPKKFFKAKKKNYDKRREIVEKDIQYKKKTVVMANPVPKEIEIMENISVSELARKMNLKASEIIGKLMGMGMMVTINQQIDHETATIVAEEYDCKVKVVSLYDQTVIESEVDNEADLKQRPPIVTVMGHVDHGKTKLLDAIRSADVTAGESGGITQHIGAYTAHIEKGDVTFLDTPGHEAFTLMRARGAQVTDIVILVVAANDGVMPQTIEAINHAKDAGVPIIVAVNKCDLPEANVDRVKQQLSEYELLPEDWGGQTMFYEISALKKKGITELLEGVLLEAEVLELKANWDCRAEGKIIESKIEQGRGTVSTVLVERGTLKVGDAFVAGVFPGRVRAIFDDHGKKIKVATPSMPVEITGFTGVPDAGDPFQVTSSEKQAKQIGDKRQELKKMEQAKNVKKITLDNLYDSIQDGEVQELKVIVKGDVQGSVEAVKQALEKLTTREIRLAVVHSSAGAINRSDVMFAAASNAIIVGFHVRPTPEAQAVADEEKVEIRKYSIIYDAIADIRSAMEGMLAPELQERQIGTIEVRETFKVPKIGLIAGCYVTDGLVKRGSVVKVFRESVEIHSGTISSLKRFKDDAKEVATGYECGIGITNYTDVKVGDIIEAFEVIEVAKKLGEAIADEKKDKKADE